MVTKWKSYRGQGLSYYFACILLVLVFGLVLTFGVLNIYSMQRHAGSWADSFRIREYKDSMEFQEMIAENTHLVLELLRYPNGEEGIKEGLYLSEQILESHTEQLFRHYLYQLMGQEGLNDIIFDDGGNIGFFVYSSEDIYRLQEVLADIIGAGAAGKENLPNSNSQGADESSFAGAIEGPIVISMIEFEPYLAENSDHIYWLDKDQLAALKDKFAVAYAQEIKTQREQLIYEQLRTYRQAGQTLKENGVSYYAEGRNGVVTNLAQSLDLGYDKERLDSQIRSAGVWLIYDHALLERGPATVDQLSYYDMILLSNINSGEAPQCLYFSVDNTVIAAREGEFLQMQVQNRQILPLFCGAGLLLLLLLIYVSVACGKKDENGQIVADWSAQLWSEIYLALFILALVGGGALYLSSIEYTMTTGRQYAFYWAEWDISLSIEFFLLTAFALGAAALGLAAYLALVKKLKTGCLWRMSLVGSITGSLWQLGLSIFNGGTVERKMVLTVGGLSLLSGALFFFAPLVTVPAMIIAGRYARKFEVIKSGVKRVKDGEITYKIPLQQKGELGQLAADINDISSGLDAAVQQRLKNERLRTELISNVSHDLKTPLTSIVTYVDLLEKEGLTSANAGRYLEIIDQKTKRLQKLTVDLFDAAKASSGAIPVSMGKVELKSLINQGLGEMEAAIMSSGLEIIVNAGDDKYYVEADGRLLWRVVENLLTNVVKYAQENTRVYIDLKNTKTQAIMVMKNISKNQLNISADELMERFKRGDESRTTEGSGLGLAIAKDLVQLQKGIFDIMVDGDLFKATIIIKRYPDTLSKPIVPVTDEKGDNPREQQKAEGLAKAGLFGRKKRGKPAEIVAELAAEAAAEAAAAEAAAAVSAPAVAPELAVVPEDNSAPEPVQE